VGKVAGWVGPIATKEFCEVLPDYWERDLEAALEEVQQVVNDELGRQYGQLGESLRDFLYELFNYPLERPWPDSLAIFAEHWTDRGLKMTPRTLDSIWQLIAEELGGSIAVELAEAPETLPKGSSAATDAVLLMAPATSPPSETGTVRAETGFSGYEFAARQLGRSEQLRLSLTDEERKEYEAFVVRSLRAQARGEPPILPPLFWYQKHTASLEIQSKQPEMSATTKEAQERRALRWKYAHLDELPLDEQERLRFQALMEERRKYTEKYGLLAAFLNPAFDGTGTLNDWAMVVGGFASSPPSGLDFRSPRSRAAAMPSGGRRRGSARVSPTPGVRSIARGGQRPGRKPPFPRPVSTQRVTIRKGRRTPDPRHVKGAAAEEERARFIHTLPHEVVILWGKKIGAHGADVVSYNLKTRTVTLWDVKWRGKPVRIRSSTTFEQDSNTLAHALEEATRAVRESKLTEHNKEAAIRSIRTGTFQTRTLGTGQAKNSTFGDHQ